MKHKKNLIITKSQERKKNNPVKNIILSFIRCQGLKHSKPKADGVRGKASNSRMLYFIIYIYPTILKH